MPKKGTRTIEVDGVRYRYRGDAWRMEGDDCGELLIELADRGGEEVRATFSYSSAPSIGGWVTRSVTPPTRCRPTWCARPFSTR